MLKSVECPRSSRANRFSSLVTIASLTLATAQSALGAAGDASPGNKTNDVLSEVVVTGSLIPQAQKETAQPVTTITQEDLQAKGFSNIAEALQRSSFATGNIQNPQETNAFTPGAQVVSFFGLSPSYTKFLIDGRPVADYPALYNGSNIVTSISGIPTILIESVDVLPGGQSSIYGSDAIAGVVNMHLRHSLDGPLADVRYGWTKDGGGTERRLALADGITIGSFKAVVGGEYERTDPIWGYQRRLSDQYFSGGSSPQTAERDWLVTGLFGQANGDLYYMEDPALCTNVQDQVSHTVALRSRPARGEYCGTYRTGYSTINNGTESTQGYLRLANDFTDHFQVFADVLVNHDVTKFSNGAGFLDTADDSAGPYYYYEDPRIAGDFLNVQQIYSPEEAGNLGSQEDKNTVNTIRATVGMQGDFAADWKYLADFTFTENKLTESYHGQFESAINAFYGSIFGPNLGFDAANESNTFAPNYGAFYKPITPAQYASFSGYSNSYSHTEESLARAELTNSNLFTLPGGNAGIAALIEGGGQGWSYEPDARYLTGETYLLTSVAGSGHRSRYAGTAELRLPVLPMLTVDASNRYDDYRVSGDNVHKDTYNLGLEFRPLKTLLFRARYGTAFKAPTLADEYQGRSGFFTSSATDYYTCTKQGFTNANGNLGDCPYAATSFNGTTAGNPRLEPITAKIYGGGIDWTPTPDVQASIDYLHWKISNEVQEQDADQLLRLDSACLLGQLDINSPTCQESVAQITRDANGLITLINTPKINVAEERLGVLFANLSYTVRAGAAGNFTIAGSYSNVLQHSEILFAGDSEIDLLNSPFYSTEFKTKANATLSWDFHKFGASLFVERLGQTPNYQSQQDVSGYAQPGAAALPPWTVANLSVRYEVIPSLVVSGNINNVTNKLPPIDRSTPGIYSQPFNVENYNNYGRSYFVEVSYGVGTH